MLNPIQKTILYDQNAIYYGYPIELLMERAGRGIANVLLKKYGRNKRIGFFCGPGNNGGDGFAAARYLRKASSPEVYLMTGVSKIKTPESRRNWQRFKGEKYINVRAKDIPNNFDIVVECLFGTGIQGKIKEPYGSVIKKLNRLRGRKVTIDLPAPGFKPKLNISMMFPKAPKAVVVDIGYPSSLKEKIGVGEMKVLHRPKPGSHKGNNGKLLIVGGSDEYHGAPLLAAKIAGKIVDLVYFSSVPQNNILVKKIKARLAEVITVPRQDVMSYIKKVDAVLLGPGLGVNKETEKLVNKLLKKFSKKNFVLDADALQVVDKRLLNRNCIITPHHTEFKRLFKKLSTRSNVDSASQKYKCVIALKGKEDYVCGPEECKINKTGNAGMTKGGTGDVLAGLIAALACKNDLFLAASAGVFINGLAGDRLKKKVSYYYSASDLVREIPRTIKWCEDY